MVSVFFGVTLLTSAVLQSTAGTWDTWSCPIGCSPIPCPLGEKRDPITGACDLLFPPPPPSCSWGEYRDPLTGECRLHRNCPICSICAECNDEGTINGVTRCLSSLSDIRLCLRRTGLATETINKILVAKDSPVFTKLLEKTRHAMKK